MILMKDVESVIMQSGSSMNALFFIKKKAKILNIHNETGDSDIWVQEISNFLGFKYFLFRGKNVKTTKIHNIVDNSNFKIDINQFEYCYNLFFKNS
jgi:capsular polysaccharide biosynthesis protein